MTVISVETLSSDNSTKQLFMSEFTERRFLIIQPVSSLLLSVTFIPSFRNLKRINKRNNEHRKLKKGLSKAVIADFNDLIGPDQFDSNDLEFIHNVQTTLIINTTLGLFHRTVNASAVEVNPFHLPHTISFYSDGYVSRRDFLFEQDRMNFIADKQYWEESRYQFDLYIDNPWEDSEIRLKEIYLSRPDLVSLTFQHDGKRRFNNCKKNDPSCNQPSAQDVTGPPIMTPGAEKVYVGTIYVDPSFLNLRIIDTEAISLGYLRIVTPNVTLTVDIEYIDGQIDSDSAEIIEMQNIHQTEESSTMIVDKETRLKFGESSSHLTSSNNHITRSKCDPFVGKSELMIMTYSNQPTINKEVQKSSDKFVSSPSFLDFGTLTNWNEKRMIDISVTNNGDEPVRLMRYKVSMDAAPRDSRNSNTTVYNQNDVIFLSGNDNKEHATLSAELEFAGKKIPQVIQPKATATDFASIILQAKFDPSESSETMPLSYRGSILLHFGPLDKDFSDWKNTVIGDPLGSHENLLEIKFEVKVMYGGMEYHVDEVYFPTRRSQFVANEERAISSNDAKCSKGFHRTIHLKNSFPAKVRIIGMKIQNDSSNVHNSSIYDCRKNFNFYDFEGSNYNTKYSDLSVAQAGKFWGGITLSYEYFASSIEKDIMFGSFRCNLIIETDIAGYFYIPLSLFSGLLQVEADRTIVPIECQNSQYTTDKFGMDCLESTKDSILGKMISSSIVNNYGTKSIKPKVSNDQWKNSIFQHFSTLANRVHGNNGKQYSSIDPVMISLGSLSSNSTDSYSLYLKNLNPMPFRITELIPAIEGLEIRLARTLTNMKDFINAAEADIIDEPQQSNEWIKFHLSQKRSSILDSFLYRDDINLSSDASSTLQKLYQNTANIHIHRNKVDGSLHQTKSNHTNYMNKHPPRFSETLFVNSTDREIVTPILQVNGRICNLDYRHSQNRFWTIPPGGVARLELLVRSPPKQAFQDTDVAEILTTGLLLETSFGQLLPVILSYHTLSGRLQIQDNEDQNATTHAEARPVFRRSIGSQVSRNQHNRSSFMIQNTFSSDVLLRKVYSCNKWFQIQLQQNPSHDDIEEKIIIRKGESIQATAHSIIDCPHSTALNDVQMQSFFLCALDWLENHHLIISSDCNDQGFIDDNFLHKDENESSDTQRSIISAIEAFKEVVIFMENSHNRPIRNAISERSNNNPSSISLLGSLSSDASISGSQQKHILSNDAEKLYHRAFSEWKAMCKLNLNVVKGNAMADFDLIGDEAKQSEIPRTISTTLDKSYLRTRIVVPRLFASGKDPLESSQNMGMKSNLISFGVVTVSKLAALYVPVINPTGHPIRVRLIASTPKLSDESQFFVQSNAKSKHSWWTGGSYYLTDEKGALLISNHNVTIETSGGSSLSLMNPSLHSSSAFTHGCSGRRCGTVFPSNNNHRVHEIQNVSPIGASAAVSSILSGRFYSHSGNVEKVIQSQVSAAYNYPPFALGSRSLKEITIPPYGSANLGPVYFRPPSRNRFRSKLYLENSWTGLEKIRVEGTGGWEKIIFLETNDSESNIETRFNKPTLMFMRTKKEGTKKSLVRHALIANVGDTTVKVDGLYLREANSAHSHSIYPGQDNTDEVSNRCKRRGFEILDCNDTYHGQNNQTKSNDVDSFTLKPKEARNIHVMLTHDCSFKSMYITLVLDYTNSAGLSVHRREVELLLGYDLDQSDVDYCMTNHNQGLSFDFSRIHIGSGKKLSTRLFILKFFSCILPLFILTLILIEIIFTVYRRRVSSKAFRNHTIKNVNNADSSLSKVDHDSADLTNLGKEQIRQNFLPRFREDGMLQPQCVLLNGTLGRERQISIGNQHVESVKNLQVSKVTSTPASRRVSGAAVGKTLSEHIFLHYRFTNDKHEDEITKVGALLPYGFDWKKAVTKGIIRLHSQSTPSLTRQIPNKRGSYLQDSGAVKASEKVTKEPNSVKRTVEVFQPKVSRKTESRIKENVPVDIDTKVKQVIRESLSATKPISRKIDFVEYNNVNGENKGDDTNRITLKKEKCVSPDPQNIVKKILPNQVSLSREKVDSKPHNTKGKEGKGAKL